MFGKDLIDRVNCESVDKHRCLPIIADITKYSMQARRDGLLALEDSLESCSNKFLKRLLMLVIDGTDPAIVCSIAEITIRASHYIGADLLEKLIITAGVLAIQQGENPRIIQEKLIAYLGESMYEEARSYFDELNEENIEKGYKQFIRELYEKKSDSHLSRVDDLIIRMDTRSLERVIRELAEWEVCYVLKSSHIEVQKKIFKAVSETKKKVLYAQLRDILDMRQSEIEQYQTMMFNIIKRLDETGEIIVKF